MRPLTGRLSGESGQAMMLVILAVALAATLAISLVDLVTSETQASGHSVSSDSAYQAAEAGIDAYAAKLLDDPLYYLHYVDPGESTRTSGAITGTPGTAWTGGVTWSYLGGRDNWKVLGNGYAYNLQIVAPSGSATKVAQSIQVLSTGCRWNATANACGSAANYATRTIQTLLVPSSVANFQMIANAPITYGSAATTNGKVYSTGTVTHDGHANADLMSEVKVNGTYTLGGTPLANVYSTASGQTNIRTVLPTPIDFSTFLTSITDIQRASDNGGVDLNCTNVTCSSGTPAAFEVVFKSDGTFTAAACYKSGSSDVSQVAPSCGTTATFNVPTNGAVYSQQTVIVGSPTTASVVKGRVTVTSNDDIVIGNNICYAGDTCSGPTRASTDTNVLGLVALNDMVVAYWAPNNLTWWAATIATSGQWTDSCGANSYGCNTHGEMDFFGSTATNDGGSMSMFGTRVYNYDSALLWLIPPWFPSVGKPYSVYTEREIPTP